MTVGIAYKVVRNQPDRIVPQHFKGAVALSYKACGNIDPSSACHIRQRCCGNSLAFFIGVSILISKVDCFSGRLHNALHRVAGGTFRNVNPHTNASGRTRSIIGILHISISQNRGCFGRSGKVIAKFEGFVSETDRLAAVQVYYLCMALCIPVTPQAEVGGHLLLNSRTVGVGNHQSIVEVLCVEIFRLINNVSVFICFDLPNRGSLTCGFINLFNLLPDFYDLLAILIIPKY